MKRLLYNTQYIDAYLLKHEITKEEFCVRADITMDILNAMYEQKNLYIGHSIKVATALDISIDTFWFREHFRASH